MNNDGNVKDELSQCQLEISQLKLQLVESNSDHHTSTVNMKQSKLLTNNRFVTQWFIHNNVSYPGRCVTSRLLQYIFKNRDFYIFLVDYQTVHCNVV